tara:strand:- start:2495 stop:3301 length:807 start_codon:yes stop_codon:yes gene_type:complete
MGNYKKTVRCGWCSRHGHNKVSCGIYKSDVEKLRSLFGDDHKDVQEYDLMKKKYSRKSSKNANNKRLCSYCGEDKHNRRTCKKLKATKASIHDKNVRWRQRVYSILETEGVGVGTLISYDENIINSDIGPGYSTFGFSHYNEKDLWMIIKIDWDGINFFESCDEIFTISLIKRPAIKRKLSIEAMLFPTNGSAKGKYKIKYDSSDCCWRIVSKQTMLNAPDNWLTPNNDIVIRVDKFFKDLTHESYCEIFTDGSTQEVTQCLDSILQE